MNNTDFIKVKGAKEHNLKNVNIDIPKNKLVVLTGVSGSGKSSLAFDTLYQEGQRRYMESLSSYARQFLGNFEKPDVDSIEGLSPSISIDQKTTSNNPRSTVGTVTEIYDYFRLLFAKIGKPFCPGSDTPVVKYSIDEMTRKVLSYNDTDRILILAPLVNQQKGHFKDLFSDLLRNGFSRVIVDDQQLMIEEVNDLDKKKAHTIAVVVDRIVNTGDIRSRVYDSLETAVRYGQGQAQILVNNEELITFNQTYACPNGFEIPNLEPRLFSFNTPIGACKHCNGLGIKYEVARELVEDLNKAPLEGGIIPYKNNHDENLATQEIEIVAKHYKINLTKTMGELTPKERNILLYGSDEVINFNLTSSSGRKHGKITHFEGVITSLNRRYRETTSEWIREWIETFMIESTCPVCQGARLNEGALCVKINNHNIYQVTQMPIVDGLTFVKNLNLTKEETQIAKLAINEIINRLSFLEDVGLGYLDLARSAATLSGGEAQRIRLATQIGSKLSGVLYVLDEPSIGLHQKDNDRLITTLKKMRDLGNTIVVVEHDHDTMLASDYLVDIGPGAGQFGGEIVACGTPQAVMDNPNSLTGRYLKNELTIDTPKVRRNGIDKQIVVVGATENNLKNIDVTIPLGKMVLVTGVSGSGKSTLVNDIIKNTLYNKIYKAKEKPGKHKMLIDGGLIDKIVDVSQSPIGRSPRSNPATYTGVFDDIRDLFANTNEAKMRGYAKGRFSFNVKGGRCEACSGDGVKKISMHFLPDVYVECEVCGGTRYNYETLQIKYREQNISDVLRMTIKDAYEFFINHPKIKQKLETLNDVGVGYLTLGQSATTLSGGEAQRVKLASELYKKITPSTLFILDEPTTGLHTHDVKKLIDVLNRIVNQGGSMIIIEHNLDVIKSADYIIDLGPEGGNLGGMIVASGTPEEVVKVKESYTGQFLKKVI